MENKYSTDWITYWKLLETDFPWPYIHNCSFPSSFIKYRICASFYSYSLNAGRGISEPKTKLIYVVKL